MITQTITGPIFHDPLEELLRQLKERIDGAVNEIAAESYEMDRREEFTTSRIAQAIAAAVREPIAADGLRVEVQVEEFPPALERRTGADLYVSTVRKDLADPISKGVLVQAKRRVSVLKTSEQVRLSNQAKRMYRRTGESYVAIYDSNGVTCAKAPRSRYPQLSRITNPMSVGTLVANSLRCTVGDQKRGRDIWRPVHEGMQAAMRDLVVPFALAFDVTHND